MSEYSEPPRVELDDRLCNEVEKLTDDLLYHEIERLYVRALAMVVTYRTEEQFAMDFLTDFYHSSVFEDIEAYMDALDEIGERYA